jgi:hypothetical protein
MTYNNCRDCESRRKSYRTHYSAGWVVGPAAVLAGAKWYHTLSGPAPSIGASAGIPGVTAPDS